MKIRRCWIAGQREAERSPTNRWAKVVEEGIGIFSKHFLNERKGLILISRIKLLGFCRRWRNRQLRIASGRDRTRLISWHILLGWIGTGFLFMRGPDDLVH